MSDQPLRYALRAACFLLDSATRQPSTLDLIHFRAEAARLRIIADQPSTDDRIATLTAERDAARAEVLRLDQALTAVRVALGAAGIPDVEPYPDEPVDDRARSLRAGGRVIAMQDRIGRLTAERDAAVRELADARRSGLTLTAEERAAVAFALGCLDAKREEEHGRFRRTHLLAEADTHSKSIRNLLAGARTVTESTAPTVADALRDDAAARGGA